MYILINFSLTKILIEYQIALVRYTKNKKKNFVYSKNPDNDSFKKHFIIYYFMEAVLSQWVNKHYTDQDIIKNLQKEFISNKPFEHIELNNFFKKDKLLLLEKDLEKEKFEEKNTDLFSLLQSNDLNESKQKFIKEFVNLLNSKEFTTLITSITGIKLAPGKTDISAVKYRQYDYLLCHDDVIDNRKVAFILNLSDFQEKDGGSLQLFDTKATKPNKIVKKIIPKFNNLVLFRVSKLSFHQVEEVYGKNERKTISGWFNG